MSLLIQIELYDDMHGSLGRRHFLAQNNIIPEPKQVIHAVNYSYQTNDTIIEVYLDQLCRAAAFHYPLQYMGVVIAMLTEDLLAQIILAELQFPHDVTGPSSFLAASIVDDAVESILLRQSFSKKIREKALPRVLARYSPDERFV
jgi:hypothetical protein